MDLSGNKAAPKAAFTLIELLVVMGVIGIMASIALPAIRGISRANTITSANRQMLDDLAMARLRAINGRTTVYVVFLPTNLVARFQGENDPTALRQLTNLIAGQYTSYALVAKRSVGDQPGRDNPRYLTEWKSLPDGALFPPFKYLSGSTNEYLRQWDVVDVPFPNVRSRLYRLPCIAFNSLGQLVRQRDELVPLAQGTVFVSRDKNDRPTLATAPDIVIAPPNNHTNNYLRVNWLTGRASLERTVNFQ